MKQFARMLVLRLLILFGCLYWLEVQRQSTLPAAPRADRAPAKPASAKPASAKPALTSRAQTAASLLIFDDDEDGYRAWLAANQSGYVINTPKAHASSTTDILHRASCATISSPRIENYTTSDFKKIAAPDKAPLVAWLDQHSEEWRPCGRCKP